MKKKVKVQGPNLGVHGPICSKMQFRDQIVAFRKLKDQNEKNVKVQGPKN